MQPVCAVNELEEDQARGIEIDGKSIVLVKKDGQVHAYLNWCPHLGIELNFMPDQFLDSDNAFLMCANHGALFEIDSGHCLSGPCSGDALMKIDVKIEGDQILLGDIPAP
ncbi:MAG: Rieske (2Fe-2S) protein [Alcanivoracaceae bacterium]|jgi:nitrite reductase/ring-hydroxylating ferredoxin subunit|nr:Rieske (2Fe-2S) protein [Alcanivoracaceae bacterium]